ncbi:MAG: 50S ribosomal protein L9 [Peptococcaceae bacterium]|jgi:large subunit ribosomal protein L9|nr:MAG: 50S ribosomal protein L9 [Peptococcaceae bacterium]
MKVVLLQDVSSLGRKGDVVEVAEGYARNYLLPRGLVDEASKGKMKELVERKRAVKKQKEKLEDEARELALKLSNISVQIMTLVGEGGKLFGSVNSKDIVDAFLEQHGVRIDKKKLVLKEPIKRLGVHFVAARLYPGVQVELQVEVVAGQMIQR